MVGQGTIVATGSIAYPVGLERIGELIGAEKVMSMTSTYDHRIIQGAESGRFLARIEALLQGEEGFYERVFSDLAVQLPALPEPPAPTLSVPDAAAAHAAQATPASGSATSSRGRGTAAGRPGRDLAAAGRCAPTVTSPRTWTRSAASPSPIRRWTPARSGSPRS